MERAYLRHFTYLHANNARVFIHIMRTALSECTSADPPRKPAAGNGGPLAGAKANPGA